jgi:WD40 repeat protein
MRPTRFELFVFLFLILESIRPSQSGNQLAISFFFLLKLVFSKQIIISFVFLVSSVQNVTLSNHTSYVGGVAFSSDHSYLASCSNDKNLNYWNATTSWSLTKHLFNNGPCNALIQLPNRKLAASSGTNINIWSPTAQMKTLTGHTSWVYGLSLSPDGYLLASGSQDNTIKLWNYTNQTTALQTLTGHSNQVRGLCFVSNWILATGSWDNTIKIWTIQTGNLKYVSCFT